MTKNKVERKWSKRLTAACFGFIVGLVLGLMVKAAFGGRDMSWGSAIGNGALIGTVVGLRFPGIARVAIWAFQSIFP